MEGKRIVVVLGASGRQGGSFAKQLLQSEGYHVRAVTRDVTKPSVLALQSLGANIVKASFDEPSTLEAVFKDAYAIFGNTTFMDTRSVESETSQGKNIIDSAAKVPTLKHLIWSGAPDTIKLSNGKYHAVVQMQAKANAMHYLRQSWPSLAAMTTEVFLPSYFENWTNLPGLFGPSKSTIGLRLAMPVDAQTLWPTISLKDTGRAFLAVLQHRESFIGRTVNGASENLTLFELLEQQGEETRAKIEYTQTSPDEFRSENIAKYMALFGGQDLARVLVTGATEQLMFFEDITTGKLSFERELLSLRSILHQNIETLRWRKYITLAME